MLKAHVWCVVPISETGITQQFGNSSFDGSRYHTIAVVIYNDNLAVVIYNEIRRHRQDETWLRCMASFRISHTHVRTHLATHLRTYFYTHLGTYIYVLGYPTTLRSSCATTASLTAPTAP